MDTWLALRFQFALHAVGDGDGLAVHRGSPLYHAGQDDDAAAAVHLDPPGALHVRLQQACLDRPRDPRVQVLDLERSLVGGYLVRGIDGGGAAGQQECDEGEQGMEHEGSSALAPRPRPGHRHPDVASPRR